MSSAGHPNTTDTSASRSSSASSICQGPQHPTLCKELPSRVHGKGMFSTQQIERGTLILSEKPLVSISADDSSAKSIWTAFRGLGSDEQQDWMNLVHRPGAYKYLEMARQAVHGTLVDQCTMVLAKFAANARDDYVTGNRILPRLGARLNHACEPNALWVVNLETGCIEVRALTTISSNKEIFVSYINQAQSRQFRQERLLEYKFACNCRTCLDDSSATEELFAELKLIDAKIVHVKSFQVDRLQALIGLFSARLLLEVRSRCLAWDTVVSTMALSELHKQSEQPDRVAQFDCILQEHLAVCYGEGFVMPEAMRQGILRGAMP